MLTFSSFFNSSIILSATHKFPIQFKFYLSTCYLQKQLKEDSMRCLPEAHRRSVWLNLNQSPVSVKHATTCNCRTLPCKERSNRLAFSLALFREYFIYVWFMFFYGMINLVISGAFLSNISCWQNLFLFFWHCLNSGCSEKGNACISGMLLLLTSLLADRKSVV